MNERRSPMYVLNDFNEALRSFARAHASLDIDLKLMTSKRHLYGDVRFYSARDVRVSDFRTRSESFYTFFIIFFYIYMD